jgi:transcriptional antiterminator NusG
MDNKWYVVHILSGQEQKVKDTLQSRVILRKLEDKIAEILIPYENVSEVRGGKKIISQRKFWPGYLFIKMDFSEETFYLVKDTPGIIGFVGASRPRPLSDREMEFVPVSRKRPRTRSPAGAIIGTSNTAAHRCRHQPSPAPPLSCASI